MSRAPGRGWRRAGSGALLASAAMLLVGACGFQAESAVSSVAPAPPGTRVPASVVPTASPAAVPTPSPAATPTSAPTPSPAVAPSPVPTPTSVPTAAPTPAASLAPPPWFAPAGATWQWQLSGRIDTTVAADIYDLDADETPASTVAALHKAGRRVICYIDVGTWESYRADAGAYPARVLGNAVDGWPDERWLDIRRLDVLAPILEARLDTCAAKGFDAVEPDWLDAYDQDTGFPITRADSIRFARWVADAAHARGLGIAQKNAPGLVASLVRWYDFALVEECFAYDECDVYAPYLATGRAVLDAEYALEPSAFCADAARLGVSAIRKRLALDAWLRTCG